MLSIIITIIAFILIFSTLILVHEWGHFTMARRAGIKVEEFGIGLPPRAKAIYKDKKGTIYSLNWIPFGGYVKLYGEDSSDPAVLKAKNSYASKTKLQRTAVILAGVIMNFLLAWFLLTVGFAVGMKPIITEDQVATAEANGLATVEQTIYLNEIEPDSPLNAAGFLAGDTLLEVDGLSVTTTEELLALLEPEITLSLTATRMVEDQEQIVVGDVTTNSEGKLGISIQDAQLIEPIPIKLPVHKAAWHAVKETGRLSHLTVQLLGDVVVNLVSRFTVPDNVAGPVGIFQMTGQFTAEGFVAILQFMALLSISLGVINVMPFPALDGGRFLFILFELIARKRPNAKWEAMIHGIGFLLLMLLILVITWNDIMRLVTG